MATRRSQIFQARAVVESVQRARVHNLRSLHRQIPALATILRAVGVQPRELHQMICDRPSRQITDAAARAIEHALYQPAGSLDTPTSHTPR